MAAKTENLKAYLLICAKPGQEKEAFNGISKLDYVLRASLLHGVYDVIATIEADSPKGIQSKADMLRKDVSYINACTTLLATQ